MENVFERLGASAKSVLSVMSVVPQALSAAILQHIAFLKSTEIEEGLAELMRFGLIERSQSSEYECLYRLKPFARAYISRVLRLTTDGADEILARYRGVSNALQEERGAGQRNRYDIRCFTVRSQSEAVVARRLRHASSLALKSRFDEANEIINQMKISSPEYFEVYRTFAFIQYRQGDVSGALASYEAALDIAKDQPQVNYFYGGFLMRSYGDFAGAREQFDIALTTDPNETAVLREASRANFFLYDFERAQTHIDVAFQAGFKTFRDEVIVNDLQAQLYVRHADHLLTIGDPRGAQNAIQRLHDLLKTVKPEIFDDMMVDHLSKAFRVLDILSQLPIADRNMIESTEYFIRNLSPRHQTDRLKSFGQTEIIFDQSGELKQQGRTQTFGFLRDTFGNDTYVNRNTVTATLWKNMCAGRTVSYNVHSDGTRTWAESVRLL